MYTPRAFAIDDLPQLQQLIQHTRLAQLVTEKHRSDKYLALMG